MLCVYVLVNDGDLWEDMVIILSEEDAIKESIKHPNGRVEIFCKINLNNNKNFVPTYNYYKNGQFIHAPL